MLLHNKKPHLLINCNKRKQNIYFTAAFILFYCTRNHTQDELAFVNEQARHRQRLTRLTRRSVALLTAADCMI